MANHPRETELKLLFPFGARRRLARQLARQAGSSSPAAKTRLLTTYYDTPDESLADAGISLRVRRNGDDRIQTVKTTGAHGVAAIRGEWEWPIETETPDIGLFASAPPCARLDPAVARSLAPIFVTDIQRDVRQISLDGAVIEAAVDVGSIRAGETTEVVRELELELKQGDVGALYQLALQLHTALPLQIGAESKAARGYRLRSGYGPNAVKAADLELAPSVDTASGVRQVIAAALDGLLANKSAAEAGDVEGVHQMRVAIRRLRAALVLFAPVLDPAPTARFTEELRRLGRVLGDARDWDVFCLETLPTALSDQTEAGWRALLTPFATVERNAAHRRLKDELAGPALTGLVLGIAAWLDAAPAKAGEHPLSRLAPELLDRVARKPMRRGRHIGQRSMAELHALRKSFKKLRYGVEHLAGLYKSAEVKAYLKHCKGLQELLGEINDATVAMTLTGTLSRDRIDLVPALGVVSRWSEAHRQHALRRLQDARDGFRNAEPFWQ
jgi:triphosphatase